MRYTGYRIPDGCKTLEEKADAILDQIIEEAQIPYSEERVQQEVEMEYAGFLQQMRYRAMGGDLSMEEIDIDEWKSDIRKEIIREYQVTPILVHVIAEEHLEVSYEELEAEAKRIADQDQTNLDMVKRFMGEDYALLRKDVLYKKAKEHLVNLNM